MKELISEDQANLIILLLSVVVTLAGLVYGFYRSSQVEKAQKKLLWIDSIILALVGPAIWVFWQYLYNPIENYYGLDSLKALKINFFIAVGFGAFFFALFFFASRWASRSQTSKFRK